MCVRVCLLGGVCVCVGGGGMGEGESGKKEKGGLTQGGSLSWVKLQSRRIKGCLEFKKRLTTCVK